MAHLEFCTTGKGAPLWESSDKKNKKNIQETQKMLFTDRIAVVFSILITSCDKTLENSTFCLFELYLNEMIKHKQNYAGILYLINLMSMSFDQYFPA